MSANTKAGRRGGAARSSDEGPVMGVERRGSVILVGRTDQPRKREESELSTKSFTIPKRAVYAAWKRVKANRGAAGIDEQSLAAFEKKLSNNLYKIWNRMSSGSYFPPPVREVGIPKAKGGIRKLGIPTVADRVAQTVVKMFLEPSLDRYFDADSYGYRPGKSAKEAIRVTRQRCWRYDWVVEFDIKGAFDNLNHDLLMKALRKHTDCKWILLYVERWLKVPSVDSSGEVRDRGCGTPQGGVVSPLLMNLFMHYAFDRWMRRTLRDCPFARYADDGIVHCHTERQADLVKGLIAERFGECGLELHPDKTRIVYCRDSNRRGNYPIVQFTFLGFTFRPRRATNREGELFTSFLPGASREAQKRMRQQIRRWRLPRQTPGTLEEFSEKYNAVLTGWWNYFCSFYAAAMQNVFQHFDLALAQWARRKYKPLRGHKRQSIHRISHLARRQPYLFVHWRAWYGQARIMGAV